MSILRNTIFMFCFLFVGASEKINFNIDAEIINYLGKEFDFVSHITIKREEVAKLKNKDEFYRVLKRKVDILNDVHLKIEKELKYRSVDSDKSFFHKKFDSFSYVRISSFSLDQNTGDSFEKWFKELDQSVVVIDLRGNTGGDKITELYLVAKFLEVPYRSDRYFQHFHYDLENVLITIIDRSKYSLLRPSNVSDAKNIVEKLKTTNYLKPKIDILMKPKSQRKFYLVFDKTCSSSCESFIHDMSYYKDVVKVANSPSRGGKASSNPLAILLPQSKMVYKIPTGGPVYKSSKLTKNFRMYPDISISNLPIEILKNLPAIK